MNRQLLALCVAALATFCSIAWCEDLDVRALQAKLEEQEARLNSLQTKLGSRQANANYGGAPESILSIQKNATVTIGGTLNTRYYYQEAKIKTYDEWGINANVANQVILDASGAAVSGWTNAVAPGSPQLATLGAIIPGTFPPQPYFPTTVDPATGQLIPLTLEGQQQQAALNRVGTWLASRAPGTADMNGGVWGTKAKIKQTNWKMNDAKLRMKFDVNEHFDAYLQIDLVSSSDPGSDNAEKFWVRWKNICNSGFGVMVGREALVFGQSNPYGVLNNWTNGAGEGVGLLTAGAFGSFPNIDGNGNLMFGVVPAHNGWDIGRVMQVTPYWEGLDGKLKFELSFMQKVENGTGSIHDSNVWMYQTSDLTPTWKSNNWGFGTMSARVNWAPIEGLNLQASVVNYHDNAPGAQNGALVPGSGYPNGLGWDANGIVNAGRPASDRYSKDNTAIDLGFLYHPAFLPKLGLWTQWIHGWNVNQLKDVDSDVVNAGVAYNFTDSFGLFAQGDYLRVKDDATMLYTFNPGFPPDGVSSDRKSTGWASYVGGRWTSNYGAYLELGWRHEEIKTKNNATWNFPVPTVYDPTRAKVTADTLYAQVGFDF